MTTDRICTCCSASDPNKCTQPKVKEHKLLRGTEVEMGMRAYIHADKYAEAVAMIEKMEHALSICACEPGTRHPQSQAQFMVAREALQAVKKWRRK